MILPTIHTNGTSAQDLRDGYLAAWRAVQAAKDALRKVEFNARDYYVMGPEAWPQAVRQREDWFCNLIEVADDMLEIAEHCQAAIDEKEARRRESNDVVQRARSHYGWDR